MTAGRSDIPVLRTIDVYFIVQSVIYTALTIAYAAKLKNPTGLILQNTLYIAGIVAVNVLLHRTTNIVLLGVRVCAMIPAIILLFFQVFDLIPVANPRNFDAAFISADRALFGGNPTYWLGGFANPVLTEILQIAYILYFLHPFVLAIELFLTRRYAELTRLMRYVAFAFLLSYLLYFAAPAVGPRFTLHNYHTTNIDLPGLLLTDPIRLFVDAGDNVALNSSDPAATVHRNCMPSGHTLIAVMNLVLAFRFQARLRYVFAVLTTLLVISTVYLRYHYVVDILAGMALVWVALAVEPWVHRFLARQKLCGDILETYSREPRR